MPSFLTKTHFLIGSIFVILGVAVWGYGEHTIMLLENFLHESPSQEEVWAFEGALRWWKVTQLTSLNPLSVVSICIGIIFIAYWLVRLLVPITIERIKEP